MTTYKCKVFYTGNIMGDELDTYLNEMVKMGWLLESHVGIVSAGVGAILITMAKRSS